MPQRHGRARRKAAGWRGRAACGIRSRNKGSRWRPQRFCSAAAWTRSTWLPVNCDLRDGGQRLRRAEDDGELVRPSGEELADHLFGLVLSRYELLHQLGVAVEQLGGRGKLRPVQRIFRFEPGVDLRRFHRQSRELHRIQGGDLDDLERRRVARGILVRCEAVSDGLEPAR